MSLSATYCFLQSRFSRCSCPRWPRPSVTHLSACIYWRRRTVIQLMLISAGDKCKVDFVPGIKQCARQCFLTRADIQHVLLPFQVTRGGKSLGTERGAWRKVQRSRCRWRASTVAVRKKDEAQALFLFIILGIFSNYWPLHRLPLSANTTVTGDWAVLSAVAIDNTQVPADTQPPSAWLHNLQQSKQHSIGFIQPYTRLYGSQQ